jgi:hypothetical protein
MRPAPLSNLTFGAPWTPGRTHVPVGVWSAPCPRLGSLPAAPFSALSRASIASLVVRILEDEFTAERPTEDGPHKRRHSFYELRVSAYLGVK